MHYLIIYRYILDIDFYIIDIIKLSQYSFYEALNCSLTLLINIFTVKKLQLSLYKHTEI